MEVMLNSARAESMAAKNSVDSYIKEYCVDVCKNCFILPYTSYDPSVGVEHVARIIALNAAHGAALDKQEDVAMALALALA